MDTQARVLILSRDNEDIRVQLGTLNKATTPMLLEYGISVNDTKGDIEHCSLDMVNTRLANKPSELKANLASEAAEKSDGMFLWLHLLSREIDPGENSKGLRNIVSEMPAGINETYERDLEKVQNLNPAQKARAIAILRWILFALRPLTVRELAEAIAATVDESAGSYPYDDLPDSWREGYVDEQYVNSYIRRSCGSLVELRGHNENKPLALHTVHFVHFSVKEYLLRSDDLKNGQSRLERICFPDGGKENDRLARLCLQYLCYDAFGEEKHFQAERRIQVYPFLAYAAKSWYMHALRDQRMSDDIMPWAEKLFNPSTSNWILWSKVFEGELQLDDELSSPALRDEESTIVEDSDVDNEPALCLTGDEKSSSSSGDAEELSEIHTLPSPIYYASLLGLTDIVKALQSQGLGCSAPGGLYGFPLQAAVHNSHQETVEYLLQQGIDVNQRGGLYGLAICAAAARGVHKILDLLIKAGADLAGEDKDGRNCLHFAGKQGARATVKALLEAGLDPMHKSRLGKTPFYEAVESGDLETVSLMLDAGADASDMSEGGIPVLLRAVALGHQDIVELLHDRHADINLPSSSGLSCLHEAVIMDHEAILDMLLANSADIHAQDEDGWTALCFAVVYNNVAAAELLISRGAYINTSADEGWTPLHIAAELADTKIMAILLRHGAAVDAENSTSNTSLFEAVRVGNLRGVEMLLTYGASVSKINNRGDTVLDDAIQSGYKNIVECLLDNHALSDLSDNTKGTNKLLVDVQRSKVATEIAKAIFRGDEDMASQLIGSSDSNILQSNLDIALLSCTVFNAPSLAEGLLRGGASLSATTHNRRTPLHFAARHGSLQLTKLFLDHDANIDAVDYSGYTPLDLTVGNGLASIDIVTYLVENGALVSQRSDRKEDTTVRARIDSTLDGHWVGTYTYNSWLKGRVDPTGLTIRFDTSSLNSKHPLWKCGDHDKVGRFEVLGHLFTNNTIRFVKLYESQGWLYLGFLDTDTMVIQGTWGSSMTLRHGSFEMKKVEH